MAKDEVSTYFERQRKRLADWRRRVENNPVEAAFWAKVNERKARLRAERERRRKEAELRAYKQDLAEKLAFPIALFADCQTIEDVDNVAEQVSKDLFGMSATERIKFVQKARQQYQDWLGEVKRAKPVDADWGEDFLQESAKYCETLGLYKLQALLKPPPDEGVSFAELYGVKEDEQAED